MSRLKGYAVADFTGPSAAIAAYLEPLKEDGRPKMAALACAGPVAGGRVRLTNSGWVLEVTRLESEFGFERVILLNDFAALAWAVPSLRSDSLIAVGDGRPADDSPAVILGSGTGLGISVFLPGDRRPRVIVGEGGHATLPAATEEESGVIAVMRRECGHVSAERALSGDGLVRLYGALAALRGEVAPPRNAAEITAAARSDQCPLCRSSLDMFCAMLGTVAGNLALTLGAAGGVYIAGGIVPKMSDYLLRSDFRRRFEEKGRFRAYLAKIPVWVVTHPEPALLGLANLVGWQAEGEGNDPWPCDRG